ncbi:MAG TPA: helix-turn-helix transcriptional regulator [Steroidobacteraceae bacterium]|nr:helix-turn-helix transcriptional regulator [Steroidobacteraceae bacterium]
MRHRKKSTPNEDRSPKLQWPFTERRVGDRRIADRRKGERRLGDRRQASAPETSDAAPSFTGRERQIVDQLMQGMTNRQIAYSLGIAEGTVKKHLHHVYQKLGVRSRVLLIVEQSSKNR